MKTSHNTAMSRRQFLKFLAASPLLACWNKVAWAAGETGTAGAREAFVPAPVEPVPDTPGMIESIGEAINVFDFEKVARHELSPAHYAYLATGVDDNATLRANRTAFDDIQLRPRRLVDIYRTDTSTEIFGETWQSPISLAPIGSMRTFHADGEIAMARAARDTNHQIILSTVATAAV